LNRRVEDARTKRVCLVEYQNSLIGDDEDVGFKNVVAYELHRAGVTEFLDRALILRLIDRLQGGCQGELRRRWCARRRADRIEEEYELLWSREEEE
jgi:hypothetical protein